MHKAFLLILCLLICTPLVLAQGPNSGRPTPSPVRTEVRPATPIVVTKEMMERLRPIAQEILEKQRASAQNAVPCLLGCTPPVVVQERAPQPRLPSPDGQRIFDNIRAMTPEQRARLREFTLKWLNERHASEQHAAPEQRSLDWLFKPSAVVPPEPIPTISDVPAIGDWGVDLKGFNGNFNFLDIEGLNRINLQFELPDLKLEGFKERIEASTNGAIGALNDLQRQVAASNQPPIPRPADRTFTRPRSASAASVPSARDSVDVTAQMASSDVRRVVAGYAYVRSDPGSFFVNTLKKGDRFRVRAVRHKFEEDSNGEKHDACYFYGDALDLDLRGVWVLCSKLEKQGDTHPTPRPAVKPEFHKPGPFDPDDTTITTRDNLYDRFAAPATFPETPDRNDGRATAVVKLEVGSTQLFSKYDPSKRNDPLTHGFSDPITTVYADPNISSNITLKVRYLTEGGQAAVVDYVVKNLDGSKSKRWAFVKYGDVNIILPADIRWP